MLAKLNKLLSTCRFHKQTPILKVLGSTNEIYLAARAAEELATASLKTDPAEVEQHRINAIQLINLARLKACSPSLPSTPDETVPKG